VDVWDVLGKRTDDDEFAVVGGVKAPDAEMALLLARESHFRHKEGVAYAVRRRGDERLYVGSYDAGEIGGVTDRSYRRQEAYAGVGGRLRRVAEQMARRGLRIDRPRPPDRRAHDRPTPVPTSNPAWCCCSPWGTTS
jgi:1,2-phenylacetyl-CoA epoxidase PaaB subunit